MNRNLQREQEIYVNSEATLTFSLDDKPNNRDLQPVPITQESPRRHGSSSLPKIATPVERASIRLQYDTFE